MVPPATTDPSPVASPSRRRRAYKRHGFYALRTTLRQLGPRTIDQRTSIGKALAVWRADLVRDLGGHDALSTQQHALVELLCRQKLLLESIDAWLLVQPSLVNARKRSLLPVVRERQQFADALARYPRSSAWRGWRSPWRTWARTSHAAPPGSQSRILRATHEAAHHHRRHERRRAVRQGLREPAGHGLVGGVEGFPGDAVRPPGIGSAGGGGAGVHGPCRPHRPSRSARRSWSAAGAVANPGPRP